MTDQPNQWIRDPAPAPPPSAVTHGDEEDGLSLPSEEDDGLALRSAPEAAAAAVVEAPLADEPAVGPPKTEEPVAQPREVEEPQAEQPGVEPPVSGEAVEEAPAPEVPAAGEAPVAAPVEGPVVEETLAPAPPEPKSEKMDWYILKVQSNREESIREGLRRRVAIAGLDSFFGDVIIPTEKVTEFKAGKRKVFKRKLYPGYLVVQMEITEETWFLVRETPGIGDFTGAAGHPTPMHPREVAAILAKQEEKADEAPKLKISFRAGDRVKIKEGTFENFEGEVASIDETNGRVTVLINIFGRSTPVDIEYWQIEAV